MPLADMSPEEAGRVVGEIIVGVLLPLLIIWRTALAIRHKETDSYCAWGLMLLGLFFALMQGFEWIEGASGITSLASVAGGLVALVCLPASAVLTAVGLFTRRRSDPPKRGLWMALTTLTFWCLVALGAVLAAAEMSGKGKNGRRDFTATRSESVLENLNYAYLPPDERWTVIDAEKFHEDASFAMIRTNPTVYFVVIAEEFAGPMSSATLASIAEANVRSGAATKAEFSEKRARTINAIDGYEFDSRATFDEGSFTYRHAVFTNNGYGYQLVAWAADNEEAGVIDDIFDDLLSGFRLLDPEASCLPQSEPEGPYKSKRYGFRVELPPELHSLEDPHTLAEWAAYAAEAPESRQRLAVGCALVGDTPVELDLLGDCYMEEMGWEPGVDEVYEIDRGGLDKPPGARYVEYGLRYANPAGFDEFYRMRVVSAVRAAYLVSASSREPGVAGEEESQRLLATVTLPSTPPPLESAEQAPDEEREWLAKFVGNLGVEEYREGRLASAVEHSELAARWDPSNETLVGNLAHIATEHAGPDAAIERLEAAVDTTFGPRSTRLTRAGLLVEAGLPNEAIEAYASIGGTLGDEDLLMLCNAAVDAERYEETLAALDKAVRQRGSPTVRLWRAIMASRAGHFDDAIQRLTTLHEEDPGDADICAELAEAYEGADQPSRGIEVCREFLADHADDPLLLPVLGRLLLTVDDYRGAQEALRDALQVDPRNEDTRDLLTYVTSLLGRGDSSRIRDAIDPVPAPPGLAARIATRPLSEDERALADETGAVLLHRVVSYDFRPGAPRRVTERRRVYVGNQRGVDSYSSLSLSFDPLYERIFINRLAVYDDRGEPVAEAELDDYYVLDDDELDQHTYDQRLMAPVPRLRPGRTFELVYTRESLGEPDQFGYEEDYLTALDPVGLAAITLAGDLRAVDHRASGVTPQTDGDALVWAVERPPRLVIEPLQTTLDALTPWVRIAGRGPGWTALGDEYLDDLNEVLVADPQTVQKAQRIAAETPGEEELVSKLAELVQRELTYQAREFGVRGVIPNEVDRIWRAASGDCKDHAVLLHHLLRAVGVDSWLALVSTSDLVETELPSLDQFDHMVVAIQSSRGSLPGWRLVDTTSKHVDPVLAGSLAAESRTALLLDRSASRFVVAQPVEAAACETTCTRGVEIEVTDGGATLHVDEVVRLGPLSAVPIRAALRDSSPREQRESLWQFIGEGYVGSLKGATIQNLDDLDETLVVRCRYDLERVWDALPNDPGAYLGDLPTHWGDLYFSADSVDERRTAWRIITPVSYRVVNRISPPAGYRLSGADKSRSPGADAPYEWRVESRQGDQPGQLLYAGRLARKPGEYEASAYAAYQKAITRSVRALRGPITVREAASAER